MSCDLCTLEKKTEWYFWDDDIVIINCESCGTPMVLPKEHTMHPSDNMILKMVSKSKEIFGEKISFRKEQRKIEDHLHWHIEVKK